MPEDSEAIFVQIPRAEGPTGATGAGWGIKFKGKRSVSPKQAKEIARILEMTSVSEFEVHTQTDSGTSRVRYKVRQLDLFEQRREKLERLRAKGIDPFGAAVDTSGSVAEIRASFKEGETLCVAGRITAHRDMGKSHFLDLEEATGRIQVYFNEKELSPKLLGIIDDLDIGDFISVEGDTFVTKTNEQSIKIREILMVSQSLRPLPEKWHGLRDVESRYRQRYLDLIANERSRTVFEKRIAIVREARRFFEERGFLEVETPILQTIAGGAAAEPFSTHHKALGLDLYLRIALELYLKRLLVGGFTKVFEINRNFRNEGISRK